MIIYLLIGLIVFSLVIQDFDTFFAYLDDGSKQMKSKFPDLSKKFIRSILCFVMLILWIIWPVSVPYILHKGQTPQ